MLRQLPTNLFFFVAGVVAPINLSRYAITSIAIARGYECMKCFYLWGIRDDGREQSVFEAGVVGGTRRHSRDVGYSAVGSINVLLGWARARPCLSQQGVWCAPSPRPKTVPQWIVSSLNELGSGSCSICESKESVHGDSSGRVEASGGPLILNRVVDLWC